MTPALEQALATADEATRAAILASLPPEAYTFPVRDADQFHQLIYNLILIRNRLVSGDGVLDAAINRELREFIIVRLIDADGVLAMLRG